MVSTDDLAALVAERYVDWVRAVAVVAGTTECAEDAVQDALVKAWRRTAQGLPLDCPAGWIVVVATNEARQRRRRRTTEAAAIQRLARRPVAPGEPSAGRWIDLEVAISRLPFRQRQVVVLYYLLGFDVVTTATSLGVSPGTVKSALSRARSALAERLGASEREEERT